MTQKRVKCQRRGCKKVIIIFGDTNKQLQSMGLKYKCSKHNPDESSEISFISNEELGL